MSFTKSLDSFKSKLQSKQKSYAKKYSRLYKNEQAPSQLVYVLLLLYLVNLQIQMPKKTKHIEKEPKEEKKVESPESTKKQARDSPLQSKDVFTQSFRQKVAQYAALNEEVLSLKQNLEGGDLTNEIKERKNRMALRVQEAASAILKEQLKSLEQWITVQKEKVDQQIKKINKAYEQNRVSLLATGSFTEEEVKNQLANVQKKAEERQKIYENYDEILNKSKGVYK